MSTTYQARTFFGYIFEEQPEGWDSLTNTNDELFHTVGDYRGGDDTYVAGMVIDDFTDCGAAYMLEDTPDAYAIRKRLRDAAPELSLPDHLPRRILGMSTY